MPAEGAPTAAMWSWQTATIDPAMNPECADRLARVLDGPATRAAFGKGSAIFQDTTAMLMCDDPANVRLRTVALPNFTASMWRDRSMRTEWLFAQAATNNGTAAITKWLSRALALHKKLEAAGEQVPSGFHFDVE